MVIGDITFENPFFLAPLAGITDSAFRRICRAQGAGLVYSEMISGKGLYYNDKSTERMLRFCETEKPIAYQVFGSEPEIMGLAAKKLEPRENAVLDINMGCPVPKVVKNGEGSALMKDPELAGKIVAETVKNTRKPVTVKIRAGWDAESVNAVETAKAAEASGAAAVAVHGRTRAQYYSGKADWNIIKQVKKALSIPVIGNGDVFSAEDALRMLEETGCDFVMIARGALGNPWIFREAVAAWKGLPKPPPPELAEKVEMFIRHFDLLVETKGESVAVKEMRKHTGWYFKGFPGSALLRQQVNSITDANILKETVFSCLHRKKSVIK